MIRQSLVLLAALVMTAVCANGQLRAATIYFDDFSGSSANLLNGTTPDTTTGGNVWSSPAAWKADGSTIVTNTVDGATLPFIPMSGKIYELSADLSPVGGNSGDWLSVGFLTGANASASINPAGAPWALKRGDSPGVNDVFSIHDVGLGGTVNHGQFSPNPTTIKIVLDTQPTFWTASWLINNILVRGPVAYTTNPDIQFVNITHLASVTGSLDNLLLTVVPEPSGVSLIAVGLVTLCRMRRRSR